MKNKYIRIILTLAVIILCLFCFFSALSKAFAPWRERRAYMNEMHKKAQYLGWKGEYGSNAEDYKRDSKDFLIYFYKSLFAPQSNAYDEGWRIFWLYSFFFGTGGIGFWALNRFFKSMSKKPHDDYDGDFKS